MIARLHTRLVRALERLRNGPGLQLQGHPMTSILDSYVKTAPSAQNAVDLFKGEWSSILPPEAGADSGGRALHFDDGRLTWFLQQIGGVAGKSVLELGPLEGGHSWMCEQADAASVVAVEANTRAYLKCLVTSEILGLKRARFLLGDFVEFLKQTDQVFDVGLACGVLYHMRQPAELIDLLSRHCRELFVWTHYHDPVRAASDAVLAGSMGEVEDHEHGGFRARTTRRIYGEALGWQGFCGGPAEFARWLTREDLMRAMDHFGFEVTAVAFDQPDHPHGAAVSFRARNRRAL
jgi:hypothetical protein